MMYMGQRMPRDYMPQLRSTSGRTAVDFSPDQPALLLSKPRPELGEHAVQCLACANKCELQAGEWGTCRTRYNKNGFLRSLNYGRVDAAQRNPIEKKPFYHVLPNTDNLSLGGSGCNAHCEWCHNSDSTQIEDMNCAVRSMRDCRPADLVRLCLAEGLPSISYTFNEPTINVEFYCETMKLAKEHGLMNLWVSNGFLSPEVVTTIAPVLDGINIDLKTFREETYSQFCGLHLSAIKRTIKDFHKRGVWVELTTLLIPGLNDSEEELTEMAQWVASVSPEMPYHISAFRPANRLLTAPRTSPQDLHRAYRIAKAAGLKYVYLGNLHPSTLQGTEDTCCPSCGVKLISRETYAVEVHWKQAGVCPQCGTAIPGVWGPAAKGSAAGGRVRSSLVVGSAERA
eukprot:RCo033262